MTTSYRVKVLPIKSDGKRTALFGGAGIREPLRSGLTLLVQLDKTAASVTLFLKTVAGANDIEIGTLDPGEVFAVPLTQVFYVAAAAEEDTQVQCTILSPSTQTL